MEHFSHRLRGTGQELNSLAIALNERKRQGRPILDLTLSNPTLVGLRYPESEIRSALGGSGGLVYHPEPRGLLSARGAVCHYYTDRGEHVEPEDLLLTASTSEAYSFLIKLLCNPGDSVCVPAPSYPLLDYIAELECVELTTYPLRHLATEPRPRWTVDLDALKRAISDKTRAIILINPNNPTGNLLQRDEIEGCLEVARKNGAALIVDEVFSDYCLGGAVYYPIRSEDALIFTLNGFSKILALPQLKLGWIRASGDRELLSQALDRLEIIADTFLSVNTPVQAACRELLELRGGIQEQIHERLAHNLDCIAKLTDARDDVCLFPPEAGWYAVLQLRTIEPEENLAVALLRDSGVYVHPGQFFGFESGCHLVLSLLTPEPDFAEGCARILRHAEYRML